VGEVVVVGEDEGRGEKLGGGGSGRGTAAQDN
jgi:hypothetical protein